jgi:hypothetical protein
LRRRRHAPRAIGFAFAAAIAVTPAASRAQTPDFGTSAGIGSDLLRPSLQGSPSNPPRFRRPGEPTAQSTEEPPSANTFTAPTRIGATPVYGSPSAFGAGATGFDSANTPRSRKKKRKLTQAPAPPRAGAIVSPEAETTFTPVPTFDPAAPSTPPAPTPPPPPQIYPNKAASRSGATLPPPATELPLSNPPAEVHPLSAANRPGAILQVPPPANFDYSAYLETLDYTATPQPPTLPQPNTFLPGTLPQRPLPIAGTDPYAALGIRAGSFLLLPSLDLTAGYSTNPERITGGSGSSYFIAAPELRVQSDWERHALTADISGSYTYYAEDLVPSLNVPYVNALIDGRVDVTRDTQILLEQRVLVNTDNPGSPNLQAQIAQLPINTDVGETVGLAQQFNRLSFSLRGTFDRATYEESVLTDGETSSNADRNFDQYAGILRVGYEIDPGLKPFVQVQEDQRVHDEEFDRNGLQRDSVGTTAEIGSAVDLFGRLTGEMAVGYTERTYQDPTLPNISGFIANGTLIWQATALTTAKLTAASQVYETVVDGASGQFSRDLNLEVDHAFRTWLIGMLKAGYGTDDYVGSADYDTRYFLSVGLTYIFTRELQMRGEVRQDWMNSTQPGLTYTATTFLLGMHLQR